MRVAIVTHQFFPLFYTGVERLALNMARQLTLLGHRCVIVTSAEYSSDADEPYHVDGVRVRPVLTGRADLARPWSQDRGVRQRIERVLEEEQLELVHVMQPMRHPQAFDAAAAVGVPVVAHIADFHYLCGRINLRRADGSICPTARDGEACESVCRIAAGRDRVAWGRRVLERADGVVCPCRHTRDVFASQGFATDDWRIVPWGVDYAIHHTRLTPPADETFRVGFLGTLVYHKGVHVLVEAIRRLEGLPVELSIYGASFHEASYEREVRRLAAGDARILFRGSYAHRPDSERIGFREALAPLDVVAIPSVWYETLTSTGLNAVASGVPLVVSAVGGVEELILDYRCGYTFPAGDVSALAELIERLVRSRDELRELRSRMLYPPGLEEEACLVEGVYEEARAGARTAGTARRARA